LINKFALFSTEGVSKIEIKFCSLASGSKGNCHLLKTEDTNILIDLGLTLKDLEARLNLLGLKSSDIDGVIVSHEHSDHIKGIGPFSRRFGAPIFVNYPTLKAATEKLGKVKNIHEFDSAEKFEINDLVITPFSTSHDAADPVGFTISVYDKKIGIATDMGIATNLVKTHLKACDILVVESNHDYELLMNGPYPWFLKQRIRGRQGHLSNIDALELINEVVTEKTEHIILAHMSETNNAEAKVVSSVIDHYNKTKGASINFALTNQYHPAAMVMI